MFQVTDEDFEDITILPYHGHISQMISITLDSLPIGINLIYEPSEFVNKWYRSTIELVHHMVKAEYTLKEPSLAYIPGPHVKLRIEIPVVENSIAQRILEEIKDD